MKVVLRRDFKTKREAMELFFELASDYRMTASFIKGFVDAETSDKEFLLQYSEGVDKFVVRLLKQEW